MTITKVKRLLKIKVKTNSCKICGMKTYRINELCSGCMESYFEVSAVKYLPRSLFIKAKRLDRLREGLTCPEL